MSDETKTAFTPPAVWRKPDGEAVSCVEKIKVLNENLDEIRQVCVDALEDAVLMGVDERQMRAVLADLVRTLPKPFADDD